VPKPELPRLDRGGDVSAARKGSRDVDFDALGRRESQVFERALLGPGSELEGPAVVEEPAASTVVFPGQRLRVDDFGNLIVDTDGES
jgi:N-methylhydantoinase A